VHEQLGTDPDGAIRFSLGPFTVEDDVAAGIEGVVELAG
jgi:hypothetical protein